MLALLALGAWASEVTLNMNNVDLQWTAVGDDQQTTSQGITIYYAKANSTTPPFNGLQGAHIRFYKGANVTISAEKTISKIVFTAASGYDASNFTPNVGTNNGGTWTGSATEITFNMAAQVRVTKIVVTLEDGGLSAPYFTPAAGTYYSATDVTIKAEEGATIHYTTDGSEPTTASAVYSSPINVASTTTIKALAEKNGVTSDVATAVYTISDAPGVENIAAYAALSDNTNAQINNPVVVTYSNGSNTYVKDATGYMCIYGNEIQGKYSNGDVIPAGFGGLKTVYNEGVEMKYPLFGFAEATTTAEATADEVNAANFTNAKVWQYVVVKGTKIDYVNGKYLGFKVDGETDTIAGFNNFNLTLPSDRSATYDIYGIVTSYKGALQLYPIEFVDNNLGTVENIAALMALPSGQNATITNPVTAVYHSGKQLYIKDETGFMLVYGSLTNKYNNGDQLTNIAGNWVSRYGMTEIIPLASTFGTATAGTAVEPEVYAIEEIDQSMVHHYLTIENCSVDSIAGTSGRNFTINDETADMVMRLNFSEVTIDDTFDFDARYNITGFLAFYSSTNDQNGTLQFYPCKIEKVGGGTAVDGDVNGDGVVTAADVTAIYNYLLSGDASQLVNGDQNADGQITAADVTAVYTYLLGN